MKYVLLTALALILASPSYGFAEDGAAGGDTSASSSDSPDGGVKDEMKAHHQEQKDENKEFVEQQHQENKDFRESVRAEGDATTPKEKAREVKDHRVEQHQENRAHKRGQHQENRKFHRTLRKEHAAGK